MPVIYEYFDVLEFLRDDFAERKAKNPSFSIRGLSVKLGLNSSTLTRIMNGKRNISKNTLPRFIRFLGLRSKEAEYFRLLSVFCQAKNQQDRFCSYREIIALRNSRIGQIDKMDYTYFEQWYYCAIREFLRVYPFSDDFKALGQSLIPSVSSRQARQAIELLERIGFIKKTGDKYFLQNKNISTGDQWNGMAIHQFQQAMIEKALEALEECPRNERDISTMTMCYSLEGFIKVKELLKYTRDEMRCIENDDKDQNRVYQINMQMFPLSVAVKKD